MVSVSSRAWERLTKNPPYYLDLAAYRKSAAGKPMETPYTPAVPLFLALREACLIVEEEGLAARIARHQKMSQAVQALQRHGACRSFRRSMQNTGIRQPSLRLNTPPVSRMTRCGRSSRRWGLSLRVARTSLKGKIFRIGNMGAVSAPEILATLAATQVALKKYGYKLQGDGVQAAGEVLG